MNIPDGADAIAGFLEHFADGLVFQGIGLEREQTRDYLQVVFDPVVNLSEENFLLAERSGQLLVGIPPLRFVAHDFRKATKAASLVVHDRQDTTAPEAGAVFSPVPTFILGLSEGGGLAYLPLRFARRNVFGCEDSCG